MATSNSRLFDPWRQQLKLGLKRTQLKETCGAAALGRATFGFRRQ